MSNPSSNEPKNNVSKAFPLSVTVKQTPPIVQVNEDESGALRSAGKLGDPVAYTARNTGTETESATQSNTGTNMAARLEKLPENILSQIEGRFNSSTLKSFGIPDPKAFLDTAQKKLAPASDTDDDNSSDSDSDWDAVLDEDDRIEGETFAGAVRFYTPFGKGGQIIDVIAPPLSRKGVILSSGFNSDQRAQYNRLNSVEDASTHLLSMPNFGGFLGDLGQLADRHGMCGRIGAFLLHRHFELDVGHIMIETPINDGKTPVLLTKSVKPGAKFGGARPSRWMLASDGAAFLPLEYSTDEAVVSIEQDLAQNESFLIEYADLLHRHGFQKILGLCIAERAHLNLGEESVILEVTRPDGSAISAHAGLPGDGGVFTTVWVPCASTVCSPTYYCQWYCWKEADGTHGRGHTTKRGPHDRI